jgi:hypothetical protein
MDEPGLSDSHVSIHPTASSVPSTPPWFGEVTVIASSLQHRGVLATIEERVRFARRRFGHYDVIDFVVVLLGYARSFERTLEAFYESLQPFATPFMALFGRERFPHRSTLSRFLAALNQAAVGALRTVLLEDLLARPLEQEEKTGGLRDRQGTQWLVFDVDGTRQAARQRALPCTPDLPPAQRRLDEVVLQGISDARGERLSGLGRPCSRPTHTSGLARFREHRAQATGSIGASCDKRKARSARICRRNPSY